MLFAVSAQASTWNRLEKNPVIVEKGKVYDQSNAPYFIVGYSPFSEYSYSFEVILDGARWNLPNQGTFEPGVYFSKRAYNTIVVYLDYGTTPDKFDARWENVYIPVACEILRSGNVYINVNGINSPVSSTETLFAKSIDGKFMPSMSKIVSLDDSGGLLGDLIIEDTSTYPYTKGTLIMLELNNGFEFTDGYASGTRKYEDNLRFFIDSDDNSKAYIEIQNDTTQDRGKITVSNLSIKRNNAKYAYKSVNITLSTPSIIDFNGLDKKRITAAKFSENDISEYDESNKDDLSEEPESSEPSDPLNHMKGIM